MGNMRDSADGNGPRDGARLGMATGMPADVMLCVGEAGSPRWLALTEGTLSWSIPTGLRFISFILKPDEQSGAFPTAAHVQAPIG